MKAAAWFAGGVVVGAVVLAAGAVIWWTFGKDYDDQAAT